MTKAQAAVLQAKWKQLVDPSPCEHRNQHLESNEGSHLTGHYDCTVCGSSVVLKDR